MDEWGFIEVYGNQREEFGYLKGKKDGFDDGELSKAKEMARSLKDFGVPIETIAVSSGLSHETIESL